MMGIMFEKYKESFKSFIMFFGLSIIMTLLVFKLDIQSIKLIEPSTIKNLKDIFPKNPFKLLGISLIQLYIYTYGLIVAKKAIKNESNVHKEDFSKGLYFYLRVLLLGIIGVAALLFGLLIFFLILTFITNYLLVLLISIIYTILLFIFVIYTYPIANYLVYYDESILLSIKSGLRIGKKYSANILGVALISVAIGEITKLKIVESNIILFVVISMISIMYTMYLNLFLMNLVHIE